MTDFKKFLISEGFLNKIFNRPTQVPNGYTSVNVRTDGIYAAFSSPDGFEWLLTGY